ncbi:unnamed protein product [Closterium sp. NIES-65]|nr:unnamed protein product [Closterium sp. NIES-65]
MREKVIPSRANPRYHYQVCRAAQLGRGEGGGEEERGMEWRGGEGRGGEGSSSGTGSGEWAPTCPPVRALTPHLPVRALTPHLPASVRTHLPANVRTHLPASVRTHLAASRHEVQVTAGQPQKNVILVCHHVVAARG